MKVFVTHRKAVQEFEVEETDRVTDLLLVFARGYDLTPAAVDLQRTKVLCRGRDITRVPGDLKTLVGQGGKVMVITQELDEVQSIHSAEGVAQARAARHQSIQPLNISTDSRRKRLAAGPATSRFIHRIQCIEELPRSAESQAILVKVASDEGIRGVLEKRQWNIGQLSELSPVQQSLLGLNKNKGQEILLRLRNMVSPGDASAGLFLDYTTIIDTMLHELAHCVHGPHDEKFYALYRELQKEYKAANWRRSLGNRTGGAAVYNPQHAGDPDATAQPSSGGGRRLGGDMERHGTMQRMGYTPGQMAGRSAVVRLSLAERHIQKHCGSCPGEPPLGSGDEGEEAQGDGEVQPVASPEDVVMVEEGVEEEEPGQQQQQQPGAPVVQEGVVLAAQPAEAGVAAASVPRAAAAAGSGGGADEAGKQGLSPAVHCPVCGDQMPEGCSERYISNHVESCVKPPPEMRCPVCSTLMPEGSSQRYFNNHVEQCVLQGDEAMQGADDGDDDEGFSLPAGMGGLGPAMCTATGAQSSSSSAAASAAPPPEPVPAPGASQGSSVLAVAGPVPCCPICEEPFPAGSSDRYVSNHVDQCITR